MSRLWIRTPLAIFAEDSVSGIVVEGARIVELVPAGGVPAAPAEVFDASRHVILPGLVNAHHHSYQTLTRAHPDAINCPLFPWLQALYPIWALLTLDDLRIATRLALTELMMSRVTTASDHPYIFSRGLEDALDIQADEARALGIRMTLNRGSMNLSEKDGGLPPDSVVQYADAILADCEPVITKHHDASEGAMMQVALAPRSPFSVTPELMRGTAELANRCGCGLHTHLVETHVEDAFCCARFGQRPVDYLEDMGWLGPRTWLAHGVHFDKTEIPRLAASGVDVCHCPTSNRTLASGQCRTRELEAAGVKLGVDGFASNDGSNLMEGMRHALLLGRLTYDATLSQTDVLRWATAGSAACLGRTDMGAIAPGKQGDLALFTLDEFRCSGAGDPLTALVLCGAHRADRVMIAGRWTFKDGEPVGIDLACLRADDGRAARRFLEKAA